MPSNGYRWCVSSAPAAAQVIALLQLLAGRPSPQPAATLARELGLPRSTTYRLLGVLKDAGFVTHSEETRRWGLGIAAYELGSAYSRQQPLQRMARAVMTRLAESTGQAAHLGVLHGSDVLYVIEERPLGISPLVTDVGVRLPANVTASGMAMLAHLPAAQVRALFPSGAELVQRNSGADQPETVAGLRSELAQVRQRGYAREVGRVTPGFQTVAAASLDLNGLPAASLAVTWPQDAGDRETEYATAVKDAARELTSRLAR
nr:IclR family transcriptional regulator [Dermacoccus sp. Tok2021]